MAIKRWSWFVQGVEYCHLAQLLNNLEEMGHEIFSVMVGVEVSADFVVVSRFSTKNSAMAYQFRMEEPDNG